MISSLVRKVIGSKNDRELKRLWAVVAKINALEPQMQQLSDGDLQAKTEEFKQRYQRGETLDALLPEAFAVCREGGRRILGMRHFDVQLIGGMVLHSGKISEMKTGEGKTLVATLPTYLNAISGLGVHVVTVNDYLARRDSEWMGKLYRFLGLSVGVIVHGLTDEQRRDEYAADITYGTNNEFGFDYLRDNMKFSLDDYVQRGFNFAVVDEVDSILIDEARTPLIISGPTEESTDKYYIIDRIIPKLEKGAVQEVEANTLSGKKKVYSGDFTVDEKARSASLTEQGVLKVEKLLAIDNLYDPRHIETLHHVNQALRAHALYRRDVEYVVKDGEVLIVDEFTGRLMPGRRWSDGLHQAVEAKEGVKIESENQTLATITFQNFFRMYSKLSGMTGTADTEAEEFHKIYKLDVVVIPTNRPLLRPDYPDVIYKTEREKFTAVIEDIKEHYESGQPSLVGTISIEKSEVLSELLRKQGVPHFVLNAKQHEREAEIVAQAGRKHAVTIATNMAGRGTDILLGGNPNGLIKQWQIEHPEATEEQVAQQLEQFKETCAREHDEVVALGGLHIIGTERHESRRIDNQLRGRSGRQGDPGSSRFYLSLQDDLLRIFGSERVAKIMDILKIQEGEAITHVMINKSIENAQKKVEAHNFEIRKHLIDYDDVMNKQREVIYTQRREILAGSDIRESFLEMMDETIEDIIKAYAYEADAPLDWDWESLSEVIYRCFSLQMELTREMIARLNADGLRTLLKEQVTALFDEKLEEYGEELIDHLIKVVMLQAIDIHWKDHLLNIDHLKEGIGLRGYGQKDPKQEYKKEAFHLFMDMIIRIREETVEKVFWVQIESEEDIEELEVEQVERGRKMFQSITDNDVRDAEPARASKQAGRNEPCPCGSGKKYKKCCGK
ncbi:MAG: preprotein translocase subunit SecA [Trichlorobacter sp.]|jgi:preprotein translocase subunit SecA